MGERSGRQDVPQRSGPKAGAACSRRTPHEAVAKLRSQSESACRRGNHAPEFTKQSRVGLTTKRREITGKTDSSHSSRSHHCHFCIGEAIERLYSSRLDHYYSELARHYRSSANTVKAIKYLRLAGGQAASRWAVSEAVANFSQALDFVRKLPGSAERDAAELAVLLLLGPVLMAARGQAATEVEQVYERAVELSLDAVGTPSHFAAAFGILTVRLVRGQHDVARKIGESLVEEARILESPIFEVNAHSALGIALHWLGEFASARHHLERASLRPEGPEPHLTVVDTDARINSGLYLAQDLWHLGYPDQALAAAEKALREAHDVTRDSTVAAALTVQDFTSTTQIIKPEAKKFTKSINSQRDAAGQFEWTARRRGMNSNCRYRFLNNRTTSDIEVRRADVGHLAKRIWPYVFFQPSASSSAPTIAFCRAL